MKINTKLIIITASLLALVLLSACTTNAGPAKADALAQCLTDTGAIMYGTEWCPHCQAQKEMFGSSFQYVNYVDCDKYRQVCVDAGVRGFPTWAINGGNYAGTQDLYNLAKYSGCSLSETTTDNSADTAGESSPLV